MTVTKETPSTAFTYIYETTGTNTKYLNLIGNYYASLIVATEKEVEYAFELS